jgi:plasmid stabilization system protein ParE
MKLVLKRTFLDRLKRQIDFIALDSPTRARKFSAALMKAVRQIPANPMLFRKSVYFDDPNVRDMIFRGYTVVFRIKEDAIHVFGLIDMQLRPTD